MTLTIQEKEALLQKYDRLIHAIVWKFKRKLSGNFNNMADLYQEAVLAYMDYLSRCNSEEDLKRFPGMYVVNCMSRYIMNCQVVKFTKRTTDFTKITNATKRAEYSALSDTEAFGGNVGDTESTILFHEFIDSLDEVERRVILMRCFGAKRFEVAKALNLSNAKVTRVLNKVRKKYDVYAA